MVETWCSSWGVCPGVQYVLMGLGSVRYVVLMHYNAVNVNEYNGYVAVCYESVGGTLLSVNGNSNHDRCVCNTSVIYDEILQR